MFDPGLDIGQIIGNNDIVEIFKCGNMGGMRRSKTTNTLVLISDYTKGVYHDKWIGGVLHYTGMGKSGDQDISWAQNATLAAYGTNNVDIHLFEVMTPGKYIYCGRIELVDTPYLDSQPGEDGIDRKVWMFPIRPVPNNNVDKPAMFVFKDMTDYLARGKNVDAEYAKILASQKRNRKETTEETSNLEPISPPITQKPLITIPSTLIGKQIKHRSYGNGTIIAIAGAIITVSFPSIGEKQLGYEICVKNKIIEFI